MLESILECLFIAFIISIPFLIKRFLFKKTSYYKVTHNSYTSTHFNKGYYGEYLTYKKLKAHEKNGGRFLFNVYLPKENNETTELDVILINKDGIFVFESKNYSGWIFGSEKQKMWTQTLPQGRNRSSLKEHFLNPIMQNKLHIKTLSTLLNKDYPFYSVIVFSERCTLKDVSVFDTKIKVIYRSQVNSAVDKLSQLSSSKLSAVDIEDIYNKLYPYTQVSEQDKIKHITDIQKNSTYISVDTDEVKDEPVKVSEQAVSNEVSDAAPIIQTNETNEMTCPLCGGKLVIRTATRGANAGNKFYGCSNFPKCRYIKNI